MYDLKIKSAEDVIGRLVVTTAFTSSSADEAKLASHLFMLYLKRYLLGTGHVNADQLVMGGVVTVEMIDIEKDNKTLRAELFLDAMSGSTIPPVESDWKLTVSSFLIIYHYSHCLLLGQFCR